MGRRPDVCSAADLEGKPLPLRAGLQVARVVGSLVISGLDIVTCDASGWKQFAQDNQTFARRLRAQRDDRLRDAQQAKQSFGSLASALGNVSEQLQTAAKQPTRRRTVDADAPINPSDFKGPFVIR